LESIDIQQVLALENTLNVKFDDHATTQLSLPVRKGGLGIRKAVDLAVPSYVSSIHETLKVCSNILQSYQPSPKFQEYLNLWSEMTGCEKADNPTMQKSWDHPIVDIKHKALLDSFSEIDAKRLQHINNKYAGAWLNCLPSKNVGTLLTDDECRFAVCLRLGLRAFVHHQCQCGATVDQFGAHNFVCKKNNGKIIRHTIINNIIRDSLVAAGFPVKLEPTHLISSSGKRPDGLTLTPFEKGQALAWDFTSPNPLAISHRHTANIAEKAEENKRLKYQNLEDFYCFIPLAVETLGGFGPSAELFFKKLGKLIEQRSGNRASIGQLRERISLGIQRGNGRTFLFSL
jgi:hypothetical protein